jgi:ADP-sugar diphosphatase
MNSVGVVQNRNMFGPGGNVSAEDALTFANNLNAFKNWSSQLSTQFGSELKGITIMDVFPFGPAKTARAGFVIANANVSRAGKSVPGFAFIRGNAVAVLVILQDRETKKEYVATVVQPRVPGAKKMYEEIPAGMMDASNDVGGTAAKELEEELGLKIHGKELVKLSDMYPSIGGCDEMITMYVVRKQMNLSTIKNYNKKITGAIDENEVIETRIRPYEEFKAACRNGEITDAKAQLALGLYEMLKAEKGDDAVPVTANTANSSLNLPLAATNVFEGGRRRKHTRKGKGKGTHKKRHTRKQ